MYVCPNQQLLEYRTTNRQGYRQYHSDPPGCPLRGQCTRSKNMVKVVTRHVWQAARDRVDGHRLEPRGQKIYQRRKETVERSFADAKQLTWTSLARMPDQCPGTVPVGSHSAEHQENRSAAGPHPAFSATPSAP